MTVQQLMDLTSSRSLTGRTLAGREITCGFACDLLSWAMAKGRSGMAWITVQTHMNVVAVAALHEMACVVLPDGIQMEGAPLQKAVEEGVIVLSSQLSAYDLCGRLYGSGLAGPPE
ncbi:MAG: AraC family transcriptional regulator [Eubacteriales bacterium]|nr:AraC family transcriptional regulator [Eubacteriales bacterium]